MHRYLPTVRHELMHVVESLLKVSNDPTLVDVWLTEGIAEHFSGGSAGGPVADLARMNELIATYGLLNPVAMHHYDYPNVANIAYYYYYPMFHLAVGYLVDPDGHGRSMQDLRDLFLDVRDGTTFAVAFQHRLGIGLAEYEQRFFELMSSYLQ